MTEHELVTSEELRHMLDELGVRHQDHYWNTSWIVDGTLRMASEQLDGTLVVDKLTPEQAIAATLGSEREKALEELAQDWQALYEHPDYGDCVRLRKRMQALGIEVIDE